MDLLDILMCDIPHSQGREVWLERWLNEWPPGETKIKVWDKASASQAQFIDASTSKWRHSHTKMKMSGPWEWHDFWRRFDRARGRIEWAIQNLWALMQGKCDGELFIERSTNTIIRYLTCSHSWSRVWPELCDHWKILEGSHTWNFLEVMPTGFQPGFNPVVT